MLCSVLGEERFQRGFVRTERFTAPLVEKVQLFKVGLQQVSGHLGLRKTLINTNCLDVLEQDRAQLFLGPFLGLFLVRIRGLRKSHVLFSRRYRQNAFNDPNSGVERLASRVK